MFNYYLLLHGFDFVTSQISGLKPKKWNKYIVLILGHTNNKKIVYSLNGMQKNFVSMFTSQEFTLVRR